MGLANGVHHAAYCTKDLKAQIEFFTDVIGMELVALYWMHGVEGAMHAFLKLNDSCSLAFVHMREVGEVEGQLRLSHAGNAGDPVAGGVLQHMAFNVDDDADLLAMRDRIRDRGVQVHGPVDHGFCRSIYLSGPEGMQLEFSTSDTAIDPEAWIDPEVVGLCGISAEELGRYKQPAAMTAKKGSVRQPPFDASKPHQIFDPPMDEWVKSASDEDFSGAMSHPEPPVPVPRR